MATGPVQELSSATSIWLGHDPGETAAAERATDTPGALAPQGPC